MIKNYTTSVDEHRTVAEIQGILAAKGARSININYDDQGRPSAVRFLLLISERPIPFLLPCNFQGVFNALKRQYKSWTARNAFDRNPKSMEQARRVAWRIIKDWVDSQMAIVEAEQAELAQIFLPYAEVGRDGLTVYQQFLNSTKALPVGETTNLAPPEAQ